MKRIFYIPFTLKFLLLLIIVLTFGLGSLFLGTVISTFVNYPSLKLSPNGSGF